MEDLFIKGTKNYNEPVDEFELEYSEVGEFFRLNLLSVRRSLDEKAFRKFAALDSNGARVAFVLSCPEAHELPVKETQRKIGECKSADAAQDLKRFGNRCFGMEHYPVAIDKYNNAALLAPKEELGVILANRSAAFYHMERFHLALRDCDEALKVGYPKDLEYKIHERRAKCLLALKIHSRAIEAFKKAIQTLDESKLKSEKKAKLEADMRLMLELMIKGQKMNEAQYGVGADKLAAIEDLQLKEKDAVPKIKERNLAFPSCSKYVEFRDAGGDVGRYGVATKDIMPGDIIAVDKPYTSCLLGEYRLTHCQRCSIKIGAVYPASCYDCCSIAYCSPNCRDADEEVHKYECKMLGQLWTSGSQDYLALRNLVTHEDERTAEDLFHRAYMAAWLFRVLQASSYFPTTAKTPDHAEVSLTPDEIFVADCILHHLQLLQFNSHEIFEFVRPMNKAALSKGVSQLIGGGTYPTVALFNHSCNPGIVRYFVGDVMVVRAIRTIPAGSEICENYGPIFTHEEESARKRHLRLQYWFECRCEACENHWPTLPNIDPTILRFKCDTGPSCGNILSVNINTDEFMLKCSKCGNSTNILKGLKAMQDTDALYKSATKHSDAGNHEEALKAYLQILKILDETLALPIKDYHICQDGIRTCMLALGNTSESRSKKPLS
ncbi:hypothetical protein QAD02_018511 [Eretmocerus hayati]|uniref:Uncharacterized protein n=1 Tax=Eretmocerus hayati TaxID=131215 RepID=A0ACC2PGK9_9HYME|nr:hypothetical protein QAD02_018511 [Eretmocerus hayati]